MSKRGERTWHQWRMFTELCTWLHLNPFAQSSSLFGFLEFEMPTYSWRRQTTTHCNQSVHERCRARTTEADYLSDDDDERESLDHEQDLTDPDCV